MNTFLDIFKLRYCNKKIICKFSTVFQIVVMTQAFRFINTLKIFHNLSTHENDSDFQAKYEININ